MHRLHAEWLPGHVDEVVRILDLKCTPLAKAQIPQLLDFLADGCPCDLQRIELFGQGLTFFLRVPTLQAQSMNDGRALVRSHVTPEYEGLVAVEKLAAAVDYTARHGRDEDDERAWRVEFAPRSKIIIVPGGIA